MMRIARLIEAELTMFHDYIDYVEQYFIAKKKKIEDKFQELSETPEDDPIRKQLEDEPGSYFEVLEDTFIEEKYYNSEFTQRFRYAIVIQLYSLMEKHLNSVLPCYTKHNNIDERKLKASLLSINYSLNQKNNSL